MKVIEVQDLKKKYKHFEALKGISFEVEQNEIFGILGPNGAGKTTTLEIIEGIKKQTSGKCLVLGYDNLYHAQEIKMRIGVQLQSSEYLDFLTLCELLKLFASIYKKSVDPIAILGKVGLADKADSYVKELSGGQKQRFTIATALVHTPQILFLDEPTTGLDPQSRRNMWELIKELNGRNITIVLTTHYMEEAEYLCSRVAIMDHGKILRVSTPHQLIEEVSKIYKLSFFIDKHMPQGFFQDIEGIVTTYLEFPKVIMELRNIEGLPAIIQKMKNFGINYSFLNMRTATLEDVYLTLTGHEYEEN